MAHGACLRGAYEESVAMRGRKGLWEALEVCMVLSFWKILHLLPGVEARILVR